VSEDSSVSEVTGYVLDVWPSISSKDIYFFSPPQNPDRFWGPACLVSSGYREGVCKAAGAWSLSSHCSTEVVSSIPPDIFMAWRSIKVTSTCFQVPHITRSYVRAFLYGSTCLTSYHYRVILKTDNWNVRGFLPRVAKLEFKEVCSPYMYLTFQGKVESETCNENNDVIS
jgi:hypothetical protein